MTQIRLRDPFFNHQLLFFPTRWPQARRQKKEKQEKQEKPKNELYQNFYETRKQQISKVLPFVAIEDGIKLLDELFAIRDTLEINDELLTIDWPVIPREAVSSLSLLHNTLEDVKKGAFSIILNSLIKNEPILKEISKTFGDVFTRVGEESSPRFTDFPSV